jgi:hypothetical protein
MSMMFLHAVFTIIVLQMILVYMYTILKMTYNFAIRLAEQPRFHLCFPETTLSSASPYTCTGSSAPRYGWSAAAPR